MPAAVQSSLVPVESSSPQPALGDSSSTVDHESSVPTPPSPVRPPVSPITPATSFAQLATPLPPNGLPLLDSSTSSQPKQQALAQNPSRTKPPKIQPPPPKPTYISAPNPAPFTEADNTDAAALRAAIAVLQIQKEKSRKDIKTLQELREGLIEDPDAFTQELLAGRLRQDKSPNDPLHATFASSDPDEDIGTTTDTGDKPDAVTEEADETTDKSPVRYPPIPNAQNVVRCPPINWAKYHIAGEPLDRMHQEQRTRPTAGEPVRDASLQQQQLQLLQQPTKYASPSAEHHVFAPYEPWRDKPGTAAEQLGLGMQTRKGSKKTDSNAGTSF